MDLTPIYVCEAGDIILMLPEIGHGDLLLMMVTVELVTVGGGATRILSDGWQLQM